MCPLSGIRRPFSGPSTNSGPIASAKPPRHSASARSASPTTSSPNPGNPAIPSPLCRGAGSLGGAASASREKETPMGFDQYHEPPEELPDETRTFARLCASLTEEAEAIGWYEQRLAVEGDPDAQAIMRDAQG